MRFVFDDLRSGVRMLLKYPTLSIVAIVTFGLGIGFTTTAFSIINGAMFKGLPFRDPSRVVKLSRTNPSEKDTDMNIGVQDLAVFRQRLTVFSSYGEFTTTAVNLSAEALRPERYSAGQMTVAAWQTMDVKAVM